MTKNWLAIQTAGPQETLTGLDILQIYGCQGETYLELAGENFGIVCASTTNAIDDSIERTLRGAGIRLYVPASIKRHDLTLEGCIDIPCLWKSKRTMAPVRYRVQKQCSVDDFLCALKPVFDAQAPTSGAFIFCPRKAWEDLAFLLLRRSISARIIGLDFGYLLELPFAVSSAFLSNRPDCVLLYSPSDFSFSDHVPGVLVPAGMQISQRFPHSRDIVVYLPSLENLKLPFPATITSFPCSQTISIENMGEKTYSPSFTKPCKYALSLKWNSQREQKPIKALWVQAKDRPHWLAHWQKFPQWYLRRFYFELLENGGIIVLSWEEEIPPTLAGMPFYCEMQSDNRFVFFPLGRCLDFDFSTAEIFTILDVAIGHAVFLVGENGKTIHFDCSISSLQPLSHYMLNHCYDLPSSGSIGEKKCAIREK